jgi:hypothetical protein
MSGMARTTEVTHPEKGKSNVRSKQSTTDNSEVENTNEATEKMDESGGPRKRGSKEMGPTHEEWSTTEEDDEFTTVGKNGRAPRPKKNRSKHMGMGNGTVGRGSAHASATGGVRKGGASGAIKTNGKTGAGTSAHGKEKPSAVAATPIQEESVIRNETDDPVPSTSAGVQGRGQVGVNTGVNASASAGVNTGTNVGVNKEGNGREQGQTDTTKSQWAMCFRWGDKNSPKLRPVPSAVRREVQAHLEDDQLYELRQLPKGDLLVVLTTEAARNKLLTVKELMQRPVEGRLMSGQRVTPPRRWGVIRGVPPNMHEDYIWDALTEQGVKGMRSLGRTTIAIEFSAQEPLPASVWLHQRHTVFEYEEKPIICWRCLGYHHVQVECRGRLRCRQCGDYGHHSAHCKRQTRCGHCWGDHQMGDTRCTNYKRAQEVMRVRNQEQVRISVAQEIVRGRRAQGEAATQGPRSGPQTREGGEGRATTQGNSSDTNTGPQAGLSIPVVTSNRKEKEMGAWGGPRPSSHPPAAQVPNTQAGVPTQAAPNVTELLVRRLEAMEKEMQELRQLLQAHLATERERETTGANSRPAQPQQQQQRQQQQMTATPAPARASEGSRGDRSLCSESNHIQPHINQNGVGAFPPLPAAAAPLP